MTSLPKKETMTIEFKSDRKCLSDEDLVEAVVGMVNAEGGDIYLGIEDDGTPTGLHARHAFTEMLTAMIGNRTLPAVAARVEKLRTEDGTEVLSINVPMMREIVMTSSGKLLRRRLGSNGVPCTVPMHPYEIASRQSRFGKFDYSAQPCLDATLSDLDPIERLRLRQAIETYRGDRSLLDLRDEELDGALGLVTRIDGVSVPTHAGMLLLGREERLADLEPTHEVMFQELRGAEVRVNEGLRQPLIKLFERVTLLFEGRYEEEELMSGMFRVPLPNYDKQAFREALVNALAHRDYALNNAIYIRLNELGLSISNPGSFIEGVSTENILRVEPQSRNHVLADALKRIGLAERTGRGVDNIIRAVLRAGRPQPSYAESTETYVKLSFPLRAADKDFVKLLIDLHGRMESEPTLEMLIILRNLRDKGAMSAATLSRLAQMPVTDTLAALRMAGVVVELDGGFFFLEDEEGKTKKPDIDYQQLRQIILEYVFKEGKITRQEAVALCMVNENQAKRLLQELVKQRKLFRHGMRKSAFYTAEL